MAPLSPCNDEQRLEALRRYGILDTPAEEAFDGIARLAAQVCRAPIAVVNFIDEDRQWFKSEIGLGVRETPLDISICAHAILRPGLFIVPDTTKDERFARNPLVASGPRLRFYAGALLETSDGHALGTLCVLDFVPRDLDEAQRDALSTLARQVMAQLDLRRELAAQALIREELREARDAAQRANRVLAESEERHRCIAEFASDYAVSGRVDEDGRVVFEHATDGLPRVTGYTLDELNGRGGWEALIHPEDIPVVQRTLGRAVAGEPAEGDVRIVTKGGEARWLHFLARGVHDPGLGRVARLYAAAQDITERKRAEGTLRFQHELTRAITDNATTAIFMMDDRSRCIFMNPAAEAMTGHPFAEAEGRVLHDLIHHTRPDGTPYPVSECPIDRALPERFEVKDHEDVFVRKDGTLFPLLCNARPIRDGASRAGTVIEVRDITERKRFEDELRLATDEAEAANRAKTQFLAVLSHELRTPLNPILLAVSSMLERTPEPEDLHQTLEMIRQNVNLQARLIDDLLDVMRIVRGKMPLHWAVADCHEVIRHALQVCQSEVLGKVIRLTLDLAAVEHHVNADSARLQQVFWNLIKNAVKFSPEGGTLTIRTRNDGDRLFVEFADTGIGIEPDVLPAIWDPFQQGETTITRRFGGLGLGLAICKGVVEAHGGTIDAESGGKGRGTTFRVVLRTLPAPATQGHGKPTDRLPAPAVAIMPAVSLKILVVEDEPATQRLMARLLRGLGHEVTTAGTVAEAARLAEAGDHGLIVSDIGLPDGSGLDLMRRVVALRGRVPSIALTGYGMEEDIVRSREAGFTAHMTKPIDFTKLEAMIRQVAGGGGKGRPPPPREP